MSAMSLRLSESLHEAARELARREGISVNQLVTTALAEKLTALMTEEYIERAKRGSREKFLAAMARVPDIEPEAHDRFPAELKPGRPSQAAKVRGGTQRRKRAK
jgi:hypothetical protein